MMALCVLLALIVTAPAVAQDAAPEFTTLLGEADGLARAGRGEEAEQTFERAIEAARSDDERAHALWMLANSRRSRGDQPGAVRALERSLGLTGEGGWLTPCLSQLASLAPRAGRPDLARRANERLVAALGETSAEAAPAMLWLARTERDEGDLDAALYRLRLMVATGLQTASHVQARELLAECLIASGEREEALQVARREEREPHRARLLMRIAFAARDQDDLDAAGAVAREVLELMPDHPQAMELVYRVAAERGAAGELVAELRERAAGDDPEPALRFLARIASWEGDPEGALTAYERLLALHPEDADLHEAVGGLALDAGELERAERALRRALELNPEHGGAANALGEVLVRRGRTEEAVAVLKRAMDYDPRDLMSARSLGHALARHSLHHEAARTYREARQATGDERALAWEMARAHVALLEYEPATEELLVALADEQMPARIIGHELERLAADEIAAEQVMGVLERHAQEDLTDGARIALGRAWLAAGQRDRALELLGDAASAGLEIAQIARESELRGEEEAAVELYALALRSDLPPSEATDVGARLARMEAERGRWRQALAALDAAPPAADPGMLVLRVELLLHHARRPEEAGRALERLVGLVGDDPVWSAAIRWARAEWLFASGRLDEAEAAYSELLAGRPADDDLDLPPLPPGVVALPGMMSRAPVTVGGGQPARAALRLGEIALRRGEPDRAEERLRLVAEAWPDSDEANDALSRLAFIRENLGDRERSHGGGRAEEDYLAALGLVDRGAFEAAEALLREVAATRGEPLADDALMLIAEARHHAGDAAASADSYLRVAERFGDGLLAPEALLRAARLLRDEVGDTTAAAGVLRTLVVEHPDSAAAGQARPELELLREVSP